MTATHTATPWELVQHELFSGKKVIGGVKDSNGDSIRVSGFALSSGDVSEANSEFIVRACNRDHAFDDLVNALQTVMRAGRGTSGRIILEKVDEEIVAAALAKAGAA